MCCTHKYSLPLLGSRAEQTKERASRGRLPRRGPWSPAPGPEASGSGSARAWPLAPGRGRAASSALCGPARPAGGSPTCGHTHPRPPRARAARPRAPLAAAGGSALGPRPACYLRGPGRGQRGSPRLREPRSFICGSPTRDGARFNEPQSEEASGTGAMMRERPQGAEHSTDARKSVFRGFRFVVWFFFFLVEKMKLGEK